MSRLNKAKFIIGTLSVVSVASIVGSIAGTVAWYQYNTRASAAYVSTAGKCSENLQIRLHDEALPQYANAPWQSDIRNLDVQGYLTSKVENAVPMGSSFSPVTVLKNGEGIKKDGDYDAVKSNPIRQHFPYSSWVDAKHDSYVILPLQLKLFDVDGSDESVFVGHEVYLADLTLSERVAEGKKDISNALRVHIDSYTDDSDHVYSTWSKLGKEIDTNGYLDLDGDKLFDRTLGYEWDETVATKYGAGTQTSYATTEERNGEKNPMADDTSAKLVKDNALVLGETDPHGILNVTLTIWLEGWQKLLREDVSYLSSLANLDAINCVEGSLYRDVTNDKVYESDGTDVEEVPALEYTKTDFDFVGNTAPGKIVFAGDGQFFYRETEDDVYEPITVTDIDDPEEAVNYPFARYVNPADTLAHLYIDGVEVDPASSVAAIPHELLELAPGTARLTSEGIPMRYDGKAWAEVTEVSKMPTLSSIEKLFDPVVGDTYLDETTDKLYRYLDDGAGQLTLTDVTDEETDSVWDASSYVGAEFNVGFRFVVDAL